MSVMFAVLAAVALERTCAFDIADDAVAQAVGGEVRRYLDRRATGAFTVEGRRPVIHIGETAFAVSNGLSAAGWPEERWAVKSFGGDLVLNGKGRGLTLAAVTLLDDLCGIRFWSAIEEYVPTGDLALGRVDLGGVPAFAYRNVTTLPKFANDGFFFSFTRQNARRGAARG